MQILLFIKYFRIVVSFYFILPFCFFFKFLPIFSVVMLTLITSSKIFLTQLVFSVQVIPMFKMILINPSSFLSQFKISLLFLICDSGGVEPLPFFNIV